LLKMMSMWKRHVLPAVIRIERRLYDGKNHTRVVGSILTLPALTVLRKVVGGYLCDGCNFQIVSVEAHSAIKNCSCLKEVTFLRVWDCFCIMF
jgi:hypothetical protein